MEFVQLFLANVLASGLLLGASAWFLKRYVSKRLDAFFAERAKVAEAKIRIAENHESRMLEVSARVLPEIQQIVYRSRNVLREIIETRDSRLVEQLLDYWSRLTEGLIRYQLFVPEETFEKLHQYKRVIQNLSLQLGAACKGTVAGPDHVKSPTFISEPEVESVREHLRTVEQLYLAIQADLREYFAAKIRR
jgi:hypothetical protein